MDSLQYKWTLKAFDALTPKELYDLLRLRSEVFVVEQQCIFLDMDNKDQFSLHLMGYDGDTHSTLSQRRCARIAIGKRSTQMPLQPRQMA